MSKRVIIIHDGAMDEIMSLALVASMPDTVIEYVGVINGDCIAYTTVQLSYKTFSLCGLNQPNIYLSDARAVNAFPWSYRKDCLSANLLPLVNQYQTDPPFLTPKNREDLLSYMESAAASGAFTLLCLGPLSDAAYLVENLTNPTQVIDSIVWTGGDISLTPNTLPPVNIDTGQSPGANPYAEWNVYWDPFAVATVFASGVPVTMFPTLVTDQVPLSQEMLFAEFIPAAKNYRIVDLASQLYAIAGYESGYHLWNTCTAAYLARPDLYTTEQLNITVDTSLDPTKQGTMYVVETGGYSVNVATSVNTSGFYSYYLAQLETFG